MAVACFFLQLDRSARRARALPGATSSGPILVHAGTQKDVYDIYRKAGLWGARIVHLNRHVNMVTFSPREARVSAPFPIRAMDVRVLYEKGIDSHNWLFIAARSGMVRAVTSVLTEDSLRERFDDLQKVPTLSFGKGYFRGFTDDIPWAVATVDTLPVTDEPVVVNIDAGFFLSSADPAAIALSLKKRLPDVRMLVLIASADEPDITAEARRALARFEAEWTGL